MQSEYDVVVVGGGHNGLVAATRLATAGYSVLVAERRGVTGGAAASAELWPGTTFSVYSYVTFLLHEAVVDGLGVRRRLPAIKPLGRSTVGVIVDTREIVTLQRGTPEETRHVIAGRFGAAEARAYSSWVADLSAIATIIDRRLLGRAPTLGELGRDAIAAGVGPFFDELATEPLIDLIERRFRTQELRALILKTHDGRPDRPGAGLAQCWLETGRFRDPSLQGIPLGGMGRIAAAFEGAARDAGVDVSLATTVDGINLRSDGVVDGIVLSDGTVLAARRVVTACHPRIVRDLLPDAAAAQLFADATLDVAPAAAKYHALVAGDLDLSRLLGARAASAAPGHLVLHAHAEWYHHLAGEMTSSSFPISTPVEVQIPTYAWPEHAPTGRHCVSALLSSLPPHPGECYWSSRGADLMVLAEARIESFLPGYGAQVEQRALLTPDDLERDLGLIGGCIDHLGLTPDQSYSDRPAPGLADGVTPVRGLFMGGAGIYPGGSVTGVPGWRVADAILAPDDGAEA